MGFATHLGPWLLGTVRYTTGTTAGTVRNTGCTTVAQSGVVTKSTTSATTLFALPAGLIVEVADQIARLRALS